MLMVLIEGRRLRDISDLPLCSGSIVRDVSVNGTSTAADDGTPTVTRARTTAVCQQLPQMRTAHGFPRMSAGVTAADAVDAGFKPVPGNLPSAAAISSGAASRPTVNSGDA